MCNGEIDIHCGIFIFASNQDKEITKHYMFRSYVFTVNKLCTSDKVAILIFCTGRRETRVHCVSQKWNDEIFAEM